MRPNHHSANPGRDRRVRQGLRRRVRTSAFEIFEYAHPPGHAIPAHRHAGPVVVLAIDGDFQWRQSRHAPIECAPGQLLVVPPEEAHSEHVHRGGAHGLLGVPTATAGEPAIDRWLQQRALVDLPATRVAAMHARREIARFDQETPLALESLFWELLRRAPGSARRGVPGWVARVQQRLADDPYRQHRLADLADAEGASRSALAFYFKRAYGVTVGEYLRARRIERAVADVATSKAAIRDIAGDCGFYDQSHFTAAFRRHTGMTPRVFRRQRRG